MSDTGGSARIGRCARIGRFEPEARSKAGMQALSPTHNPYSATNALESRGSGESPNPLDLGAFYFISGSHSIKGRCSISFSSTTFHNAVG